VAADLGGGDLLGRHDGPAVDIAIAGDRVASASLDHTVRLWSPAGTRVLRAGAPVYAVVLAPGPGLVAALTDDVLVWPLAGDAAAHVLMRGAATRNDLALLGDGHRLVAIGESPQMVFDLTGATAPSTFTTPAVAYSGAATATGARVVLVGWGGFGGIVDLERDQTITLGGHYLDFNTARFAPDGAHVATAGEDGLVGVWRAADGRFAWGERATAPPLGVSADAADATRDVPTAAFTAGPLRFTGHSSGLVTIHTGGRRTASFHLHGAITTLARIGTTIDARTVTGSAAAIPLPGLDDAPCALVQSLWRDVPVAWRDGRVQPTPPPARPPCR
jgi:WD40 repeat protein